jgi:hypothetical protein
LPGALSLDSISATSKAVQPFDDERPREWSPKKKKRVVDAAKVDELTSSSDDDDGSSSGEEFSLECNPPPIETVAVDVARPKELAPRSADVTPSAAATSDDKADVDDEEARKKIEATQQVSIVWRLWRFIYL